MIFAAGALTLLSVLAWPALRRGFEREQLYMLALIAIGVVFKP